MARVIESQRVRGAERLKARARRLIDVRDNAHSYI